MKYTLCSQCQISMVYIPSEQTLICPKCLGSNSDGGDNGSFYPISFIPMGPSIYPGNRQDINPIEGDVYGF